MKALEKEEQARKKAEEELARRRQQALETELRIQEEILKKKEENDRFLASSTTNRTNTSASIFNRLYTKPSNKTNNGSCNSVVVLDGNEQDSMELEVSVVNVSVFSVMEANDYILDLFVH